jgi:hypothetical protein
MQPIVSKLQPICRSVGPTIMPFVMEPAWRATGEGLQLPQKSNGKTNIDPTRIPTSDDTNTTGFGPRLNPNAEAIIKALTENLTMQDAEAFTETNTPIGEAIGKALRLTGPVLRSVPSLGSHALRATTPVPKRGSTQAPKLTLTIRKPQITLTTP